MTHEPSIYTDIVLTNRADLVPVVEILFFDFQYIIRLLPLKVGMSFFTFE